jgi:hypothetical protein
MIKQSHTYFLAQSDVSSSACGFKDLLRIFRTKKTYKILERSHHPMAISANCFDTQGIPKGQTPRVASDASPALWRLVAASLLWMVAKSCTTKPMVFQPYK